MKKQKILLDTDMGTDCDDAGALAVLHNLADSGKAEIVAVVHCASEISGPVAVKAINTWYKRDEIPIGRWDKNIFLEGEKYRRYTGVLMEQYLKNYSLRKFENSTRVMRRTLAENNDVTITVIGMLNNVAELLKSQGDDISPLSGIELIKKSVKNMYVMGGNFKDLTYAEYNIVCDIESARYVAEHFPMPIIYCGFELGENVLTGRKLRTISNENPVKIAYEVHSQKDGGIRFSWDPITVYCAVMQNTPYYQKSPKKEISFDEKGRVTLKEGGKDCYIISNISDKDIEKVIDELIR